MICSRIWGFRDCGCQLDVRILFMLKVFRHYLLFSPSLNAPLCGIEKILVSGICRVNQGIETAVEFLKIPKFTYVFVNFALIVNL